MAPWRPDGLPRTHPAPVTGFWIKICRAADVERQGKDAVEHHGFAQSKGAELKDLKTSNLKGSQNQMEVDSWQVGIQAANLTF